MNDIIASMTDRPTNELSERELEILRLVATGASNKEIARQLQISSNTVKVHLRNIFGKIGVASRTEAAMYSVRLGLVETASPGGNGSSNAGVLVAEDENLSLEQAGPAAWLEKNRRMVVGAGAALLLVVIALLIIRPSEVPSPAAAQSPVPSPSPRWVDKAPLPTARLWHALAAYEDDIFVIAGQAHDGVSNVVEKYDPDSNRWTELAPKKLAVSKVGAGVIGGQIYVPGGCQAEDEPTRIMEAYDPRQDTWSERASLPFPLCAYALVAFEGKIYIFGGWDGTDYLDRVFIYDPSRDSWSEGAPMNTARAYAGAVAAGGKIYVFGGYDGEASLNVNEVYYPERDQLDENPWGEAAAMPEGRYGFGVASLADTIYVFGGANTGDEIPSLVYLPLNDEWQILEALDLNEAGLSSLALGPYLYAVGGGVEDVPIDRNLVYQVVYTIAIPIIVR
jgi:DNA-binding CsgD family transcriptional regulator